VDNYGYFVDKPIWYDWYMTTILLILIVWYATKVYYTKTFDIQTPVKEEGPMVHVKCVKCSQTIYTHRDNLRAPYYCLACK